MIDNANVFGEVKVLHLNGGTDEKTVPQSVIGETRPFDHQESNQETSPLYYIDIPLLDNEETVGMMFDQIWTGDTTLDGYKPVNDLVIPEWEKKRRWNSKRCGSLVSNVSTNHRWYNEMHDYMEENEVTDQALTYLCDFRYKLNTCCNKALFREHLNSGGHTFIAAHTCKHKLCSVCNSLRAKKVRKTWRNFFETNPELLKEYDFMHLTLTVPHKEGEFRGKRWYADELMKEFNWMRKKAFWKRRVYAGEFGVEVTKNDNGLHIHIHAMLLVYKGRQNRNELHRDIYLAWNKQTAGGTAFAPLSEDERAAAMKGNKTITAGDLEQVNANGAVLIGLESLYIKSNEARPGFFKCTRTGVYKRYVSGKDNFDAFMGGVMECIKYHFQPLAIQDDDTLDFDLVIELLPAIKGKPLYRKFGAFHAGAKNAHPAASTLNINYNPDDKADAAEELVENGSESIMDPITGEDQERDEYTYFVTKLKHAHVDQETGLIQFSKNIKRDYLCAANAFEALSEMQMMAIASSMANRRPKVPPAKVIPLNYQSQLFTFNNQSNYA
jgi:hypothetical protein